MDRGSRGDAKTALERIAELYAVEKEIRGRSCEERREIRSLHSRPLLESFKQWLEETLGKLSRRSDTELAVRYALGCWDALMRYCDDGTLEIDNSATERALRWRSWVEKASCSRARIEAVRARPPFTA